MSLMSSTKNPDQLRLKSTQLVNQKTPKAKFGTMNVSRILLAHQTLRPYLYPQKPLPQIVLSDQQDSYQSTIWPPKCKLRLLPPLKEEDLVPHQHHHPLQRPPQQQTLSNKFKQLSMPPSAVPEEECYGLGP